MILTILKQQFIGALYFAWPIIIAYLLFPNFVLRPVAIVSFSLIIGIFVTYKSYSDTQNLTERLKFTPSNEYLSFFSKGITQCDLKPEQILLRYAYTDDAIAMNFFNTVIIDPMLWNDIDDPEIPKAQEVIKQHILPGIPNEKKLWHAKIKTILSPGAQRFIFKHELGHFFYNYSNKRLAVIGIIATLSTAAGMLIASSTIIVVSGAIASMLGILTGATVDLFLSYASNVFFKAPQENMADEFASKYSPKEDILAAADFFENYESNSQEYKKSINSYISKVPQIILSGHTNGKQRAQILRKEA